MSAPTVYAGSAAYPAEGSSPVVSIGNFDGVHLGHRHLLGEVVQRARERGVPACVYTFEPPPRVVLAPQQHRPRILAWPDKVQLLGEAGVDHVVVERFTRAFAQHPPEWFVDEVLGRRLRPAELIVGYDFRFGRARAGGLDSIRARLPQLLVDHVRAWRLGSEIVSSSLVRDVVSQGDVARGAVLLGRPHFIRGTVVPGDQRGRTMGYPTANLETDAELLPGRGVYAVRVCVDEDASYIGVANLGTRPTFDGTRFLIEVHLLEFEGNLYGRELRVAFLDRVRPERRFPDRDALMRQIRADVQAARVICGQA